MPDNRVHDVTAMTSSELENARRQLMVSLSLAFRAHRCEDPSSRTSAPLTPSSPSGQAARHVTGTLLLESRWTRCTPYVRNHCAASTHSDAPSLPATSPTSWKRPAAGSLT